jgi:hypothetical protein
MMDQWLMLMSCCHEGLLIKANAVVKGRDGLVVKSNVTRSDHDGLLVNTFNQ